MTRGEIWKDFFKRNVLPAVIALFLFFMFKNIFTEDGQTNYFYVWLCCGIPFGIRRMFVWLVPHGYDIAGTVGIVAINFILDGIIGGGILIWRLVAMVCLNDIPVNGNLAKIRRHVPGGDELHFLLNQCPFFLCYIEFDLYFSFASIHAITPFRSEGLGHFPTSNFQPTHRRTGGRKYGKGYSFPMLATKVFSSLVTTTQCSICQKRAKEKRCNL